MKINFPLPTDGKRHRYCQNCLSENVYDVDIKRKRHYQCDNCKNKYDRLIDIDPALSFWVDPQTKDYWHESVGVFVSNPAKKILFIVRTIFPYGYTVPAGHLEKGENPEKAAIRELFEETSIQTNHLDLFKVEDILDDPCRRGADSHRWHVYTYQLQKNQKITPNKEEGKKPCWLTIEEALTKKMTKPVDFLLRKYGSKLIK